jgi:hypothetical protein
MVLLRREQYLRLYREILGDPKIHKPTELRTDTHVGVHRVVVTRDEEVIDVSSCQYTAGHFLGQFLLIEGV